MPAALEALIQLRARLAPELLSRIAERRPVEALPTRLPRDVEWRHRRLLRDLGAGGFLTPSRPAGHRCESTSPSTTSTTE